MTPGLLQVALELFRGGRVHLHRFVGEREVDPLTAGQGARTGLRQVAAVAIGQNGDLQVVAVLAQRGDEGEVGVGVHRTVEAVDAGGLHGQRLGGHVGAPEGEVGVQVADLEPGGLCGDGRPFGRVRRARRDAVAQRADDVCSQQLVNLAEGGRDIGRVQEPEDGEHVGVGGPLTAVLGHADHRYVVGREVGGRTEEHRRVAHDRRDMVLFDELLGGRQRTGRRGRRIRHHVLDVIALLGGQQRSGLDPERRRLITRRPETALVGEHPDGQRLLAAPRRGPGRTRRRHTSGRQRDDGHGDPQQLLMVPQRTPSPSVTRTRVVLDVPSSSPLGSSRPQHRSTPRGAYAAGRADVDVNLSHRPCPRASGGRHDYLTGGAAV